MSTYEERLSHGRRVFSELDVDTDAPAYVEFTVDDLSTTPRMSSAMNRDQVEQIRDELTAWLERADTA